MSGSKIDEQELVGRLHSLPAWKEQGDFTDQDWDRYLELAGIVQSAGPDLVEAALDEFIQQAMTGQPGEDESESKPFILMRVVFDMPEAAGAETRHPFKGWTNWPPPDAKNQVNLSWPVSWSGGRPTLLAQYEGSMGLPYAAAAEYRFLLQNFPYRKL